MLYRAHVSGPHTNTLLIRADDSGHDEPELGPGLETRATFSESDFRELETWTIIQTIEGMQKEYVESLTAEADPDDCTLTDPDRIIAAFAVLSAVGSQGEPIEWVGSSYAWLRHDLDHARNDASVDLDDKTVRVVIPPECELRAMRNAARPLAMANASTYEDEATAAREAYIAAQSARKTFLDRWGSDWTSAFDANLETIGQMVAALNPEPIAEAQGTVDGIVGDIMREAIAELIDLDPEDWDVTDLDDLSRDWPDRVVEACDGALVYDADCEDFLLAFPEHANEWRDGYDDDESDPGVLIRAGFALERAVSERLSEAFEEERDKLVTLLAEAIDTLPTRASLAKALAATYDAPNENAVREVMRTFLLRAGVVRD